MQIYNFHLILLLLQVFAEYSVFIKRIKGKKLSFMQWDTLLRNRMQLKYFSLDYMLHH